MTKCNWNVRISITYIFASLWACVRRKTKRCNKAIDMSQNVRCSWNFVQLRALLSQRFVWKTSYALSAEGRFKWIKERNKKKGSCPLISKKFDTQSDTRFLRQTMIMCGRNSKRGNAYFSLRRNIKLIKRMPRFFKGDNSWNS